MNRLLLLCLVALAPLVTLAQDGAAQKLPGAPFSKAEAGDWSVYSLQLRVGNDFQAEPLLDGIERWDVVSVASGTVTMKKADRYGSRVLRDQTNTVSLAASGPTLAEFLEKDEASVKDAAWSDEKRTIAGRELACRKAVIKKGDDKNGVETIVVFSDAVRAPGLVKLRVVETRSGKMSCTDLDLVGTGTREQTLLAARADLWKLPFNPATDATVGDWSAYRVRRGDQTATFAWTVRAAEGDRVTFDADRERHLDRAWTPSLPDCLPGLEGKVSEVEERDDTKEVGGRAFACRRLALHLEPKRGPAARVTLWMSRDVKGLKLVALEIDGERKARWELAGFGTKDGALWGKKAAELEDPSGK